jgi:hypothetical protein
LLRLEIAIDRIKDSLHKCAENPKRSGFTGQRIGRWYVRREVT